MAKLIIKDNDKLIEEMEIPPYEFKENERLEKIDGQWCLVIYPNTNDIKPITIQRGVVEMSGYITKLDEVTLKVGDKINGHTIKEISRFKYTPKQIDIFTDYEVMEMFGDRSAEVFRINKIEELLDANK